MAGFIPTDLASIVECCVTDASRNTTRPRDHSGDMTKGEGENNRSNLNP